MPEASLGNIGVVKARLAQDELAIKREIASLQEELKRDQDPGRMQLIQEMISVSIMHYLHLSMDTNVYFGILGPVRSDVTYS